MPDWFRAFFSYRQLIILLQGFSSGLPLLLVGGTFRAWMKDSNVDLTTIGLFALVQLPYSFKFLWAPLVDRFRIPYFGRRRGWLLIFQIGLAICLYILGQFDPSSDKEMLAIMAFITSFFAASQDIVIDAYRREFLPENELGLGTSVTMTGYRFGLLCAGALALFLADHIPWSAVYMTMAGLMLVGIVTTLICPEPKVESQPRNFREAVIDPLLDFLKKKEVATILLFILIYKVGDSMASDMLNPFYLDIGFSKSQIGLISKPIGIWATILGGLVGGGLLLKISLRSALVTFGILQAISTLLFAILAQVGPNPLFLAVVIFGETFTGGMGSAAYGAFMLSLTNKKFSASQYALLSSIMSVPRAILGSSTGWLAENLGWNGFFILCTVIAVPGILLVGRSRRWFQGSSNNNNSEGSVAAT